MTTISSLRATGRGILKQSEIDTYFADADMLLMHVLEINKNALLTDLRRLVSDKDSDKFLRLIAARAKHVPLQYITGKCEFMSLEFHLNRQVLIPRQDTETLVETVLNSEKNNRADGLEIGVGSGCVSISLEYYADNILMYGVDISKAAVWTAAQNYARIIGERNAPAILEHVKHVNKVLGNGIFRVSDLFENVPRGTLFDFIVSNPPYIETEEFDKLDRVVKDFEPRIALDGGPDGLKYYREILAKADSHLVPGGRIYFEIGYNQAKRVKLLLDEAGFVDIRIVNDLAGRNRVIWGRKERRTERR